MKKTFNAKILDIKVDTADGGDLNHIIDAYVRVEIDGIRVWCFVYEGWGTEWSLYMKGKTVPIYLIFNSPPKKTDYGAIRKKIVLVPNQKKPCDYIINGEVIDIVPNPRAPESIEHLHVDCGFIFELIGAVEKDKFKLGDYIQAEGRLDAHILNEKTGNE